MKIFLTAILSFLLIMTTAEAAKIDAYRNIISSERFTIRYTIAEPPTRVTNREAKFVGIGGFGSFEMTDTSAVQRHALNDYKGVMVSDGANKYIENFNRTQSGITSLLKKNGEAFRFYSYQKEDKVIFGGRLGMYKYYDMWQIIDESLKLVNLLK